MRDRMHEPIVYDDKKHGYCFTGPVKGFPSMELTFRELFALAISDTVLAHYRGTSLYQPLRLAFQKLALQLDDQARLTLENLDRVLLIRPFAPEETDPQLLELVLRAVTEQRGLRFEYRKPGEKKWVARRVHPYHALQFEDRWYFLGYDFLRAKVRTFALGRMRGAGMTEERFERPKDFDVRKHFDKSVGVMAGEGDYGVVIEMDAWLTDILRRRQLHPKQVVQELPGGNRTCACGWGAWRRSSSMC